MSARPPSARPGPLDIYVCQWAKEYKSNEALKPCMPDKDQVVAYFTENKERYKMWAMTTLGQ